MPCWGTSSAPAKTLLKLIVLACQLGSSTSKNDDSKIIGGFSMKLQEAPFVVSLMRAQVGHYCGGALLTMSTVLTGCHCVCALKFGLKKDDVRILDWTDMLVTAGSDNIDIPSRLYQTSGVKNVVIHPKCSFEKYLVYDFAVITLESEFKLSPTVQPMKIPSMNKENFEALTRELIGSTTIKCYVAGWGAKAPNVQVHSSELNAVRMQVIPDEVCQEKMMRENKKFANFKFWDNAQMCTLSFGYQKNASDCVGDSGGPFFCGEFVYGIVSYGYDCGFWDLPNIYAKLSYFVEWYSTVLKKNKKVSQNRAATTGLTSHTSRPTLSNFVWLLSIMKLIK